MGNLILMYKTMIMMIHLWFVAWMCISVCTAQLYYDASNCTTSNESLPGTRYTCNSTQDSCRTFLVYRANERFKTIQEVSNLFNRNSDEVLQVNNLTSSSQVLIQGKEVLIPVSCTCSGQFYEASLTYKVHENTTYSEIACKVFEGLLKSITLAEENLSQGDKPQAASELQVPLRCACPHHNFNSSMRVKYLVTYPLIKGDSPYILSDKFGISPEDFWAVNHLNQFSTIFPDTSVLVPLSYDGPIRIFDISDSPSPPPGFLHTTPVIKKSIQPSNLYVVGSIIGFMLLIILLACGLYMKRMRKWNTFHSFALTNSTYLCSPMRSPLSTTHTGKSSATPSCLSPDFLLGIKYCLLNYTIEELKKATTNFSEENRIGNSVYKGLVNNVEVMIKRMWYEDIGRVIDLHSKINHVNIVNLIGVCYGENNDLSWSYLVFELPKNGCLRNCLSDPCNPLNWYKRTQIAFDVATCLYYLHCCAFPSYAHMNVSSRNIFITENWMGKVADVGRALVATAKHAKRNETTEIFSKEIWLAPEYLLHGLVSEKVDIFAFGVVLLELITGRDNFDGKSIKDSLGLLLDEASEGSFEGFRSFMDPNLKDYSLPEALCLCSLAEDCVADDPLHRPTMDDIMKVLAKMA